MKHLKLRNSKRHLFFFFILATLGVQGQTLEKLAEYKAKYPGNHIVQVANTEIVRIQLVKNVPVVTYSYVYDYLVLDKTGTHLLSEESIGFSSFEKVENIEAYSMVPNGKSSKKVPATNFVTRDAETDEGIFHDDNQETTFLYPGIEEGSVRHLAYDETVNMVTFPFGFFFFSRLPGENPTFIIEADTAIHVVMKEYFTDLVDIKYTEKVEKGKRIMTWTAPSTLLIKEEEFAPNPRYYAPQVLGQIAYYNTKKGRVNVIGSATDLHTEYEKNIAEVIGEVPSGNLAMIADSITKNIPNEFDKVKAIYYWVQDHVKYIAFEEGIEGFVPRQPSKVIDKRYGDCKDMASLIYSMLKSVGITSYLTWIGSRDLPYKYSEFPSSFCDNHMIATYKYEGKNYFLDATNSFQTIEYPTSFIQGKEALVHLGDGKYEIAQVPIVPSDNIKYSDSSFVEIQDTKLNGKSTVTNIGYYNVLVGGILKEVNQKDYKDLFGNLYERANNSFVVSNPKIKNGQERDAPIVSSFDWSASNYVTRLDKEMYVNLILSKDFVAHGVFKEDRIAPFEYDQQFDDTYFVELSIPEGYTVKSMPKNQEFTQDFMSFSVNYKQTGNKIACTVHFKVNFLLLSPEKFPEWNKFIAMKKAALAESLVLIKK